MTLRKIISVPLYLSFFSVKENNQRKSCHCIFRQYIAQTGPILGTPQEYAGAAESEQEMQGSLDVIFMVKLS